MTNALAQNTSLQRYGLGAEYGVIMLGSMQMIAQKVEVHFDRAGFGFEPSFVTMTVEYRGQDADARGNLLLTAGGLDAQAAVTQMKKTLDAIIGGKQS